MLTYYMSKYLLKAVGGKNAATIVVEGVEDEHIKEAAEATKGFSGELWPRWRIHMSLETLLSKMGVPRLFWLKNGLRNLLCQRAWKLCTSGCSRRLGHRLLYYCQGRRIGS